MTAGTPIRDANGTFCAPAGGTPPPVFCKRNKQFPRPPRWGGGPPPIFRGSNGNFGHCDPALERPDMTGQAEAASIFSRVQHFPPSRRRGAQLGNSNRLKHGGFSRTARARREGVRGLIRRMEFLILQAKAWHACEQADGLHRFPAACRPIVRVERCRVLSAGSPSISPAYDRCVRPYGR